MDKIPIAIVDDNTDKVRFMGTEFKTLGSFKKFFNKKKKETNMKTLQEDYGFSGIFGGAFGALRINRDVLHLIFKNFVKEAEKYWEMPYEKWPSDSHWKVPVDAMRRYIKKEYPRRTDRWYNGLRQPT